MAALLSDLRDNAASHDRHSSAVSHYTRFHRAQAQVGPSWWEAWVRRVDWEDGLQGASQQASFFLCPRFT